MKTLSIFFANAHVAVIIGFVLLIALVAVYEFAKRQLSRIKFFRDKFFTADNNPFSIIALKNELTASNSKIESSLEELKACQYELLHSIIDDKTPQKTAGEALTLTDYEPFGIYVYAWYTGTFWRVTCQLVTNTVSSRKADRVDLPGEFNSRSEAEQKALLFAESLHSSGIQKPIVETVNNQ